MDLLFGGKMDLSEDVMSLHVGISIYDDWVRLGSLLSVLEMNRCWEAHECGMSQFAYFIPPVALDQSSASETEGHKTTKSEPRPNNYLSWIANSCYPLSPASSPRLPS